MKILLDECVPVDFRHSFPEHDVHSVTWAGLSGLKNGRLLSAAQEKGYQVLLTVDAGIPHQQNLSSHHISIIVLRPPSNQLQDLLTLLHKVDEVLSELRPGAVVVIS